MSEAEHVRVVKALYAAMGQPVLDDAALGLLSEDIEFVVPGRPGLGAAGVWRGADGVQECMRRLRAAQQNDRVDVLDIVAQGEHVVVRLFVRARVTATDKTFESDIIHFFTFSGGKITRLLDFFDTAAVEAAYRTEPAPG